MTDIRNYATLREDILRLAEEHNRRRLELATIQQEMTGAITRLVECAEKLFPRALEAEQFDDRGQVRPLQHGDVPTERAAEVMGNVVRDFAGRPKRACGLCHKPGHRAPNCPEAHTHRARERERKPRKPLSEARKAQLRNQLQKYRNRAR